MRLKDHAPATRAPAPLHSDRERLMAGMGIRFDGRRYAYRGYRYDRLADAVNYAQLDSARPFSDAADDAAPVEEPRDPSEAERAVMRRYAITFEKGSFLWRGFRYDRLVDAVAYANLRPWHEAHHEEPAQPHPPAEDRQEAAPAREAGEEEGQGRRPRALSWPPHSPHGGA